MARNFHLAATRLNAPAERGLYFGPEYHRARAGFAAAVGAQSAGRVDYRRRRVRDVRIGAVEIPTNADRAAGVRAGSVAAGVKVRSSQHHLIDGTCINLTTQRVRAGTVRVQRARSEHVVRVQRNPTALRGAISIDDGARGLGQRLGSVQRYNATAPGGTAGVGLAVVEDGAGINVDIPCIACVGTAHSARRAHVQRTGLHHHAATELDDAAHAAHSACAQLPSVVHHARQHVVARAS